MHSLIISDNKFYSNRTWDCPLTLPESYLFGIDFVDLFDQNGYRLTLLEQIYSQANGQPVSVHGNDKAIRKPWITQEPSATGAHINHAFLFERKGYGGEALEQLQFYAKSNNLLNKLIRYRGKWGVDFSLDYADEQGNAMELLHFEYDSYNLDQILQVKEIVEETILNTDWDTSISEMLKKKDEWIDLDFFKQSKYKTDFFGLPEERFKMTAWY